MNTNINNQTFDSFGKFLLVGYNFTDIVTIISPWSINDNILISGVFLAFRIEQICCFHDHTFTSWKKRFEINEYDYNEFNEIGIYLMQSSS